MKFTQIEHLAHNYAETHSNNQREYSLLFRAFLNGYNKAKEND